MSTGAYVGIPTSYTPVEYIESTGTQYIDTGVVPTSTTKTEIKFMLTSTTQEQYPSMLGCQGNSSSGDGCYKLRNYLGSNLNFQSGNNSATSNISGAINTAYVATCEHGKLVLNGSTFTTSSTWTNLNAHIYLFASYNLAESSVLSTTRTVGSIYYCKIYENNSLIRDFIPVLDGSNVACLYDLVEGKFYYNKGTGAFSYGTASTPVTIGSFARKVKKIYVGVNNLARKVKKGYVGVPMSYTPVEYLESTGTQYIDTGIVRDITKVFRFVASVKWNDVFTRQCIGAQGYVYFGVSGGKYQIAQGGTTTTSVTATTGSFADIDLTFNCPSNNCTGTVNNTSVGTISATYQNSPTDAHIHLFSLNDLVLPSSVQIASFKIYQNNVLVRDFIPVLNDSNVACMIDLVEGKFYYNKGAGTFTAGSAIGEQVVVGSVARLCYKGTTIWEAFIELCRANPTKSAASKVLQYQTQIESLMAQNGKDVNSYHSIYAYTGRNTFKVIFVVPTTYWYKYGEVVSGTTYAFYISGCSGSQSIDWLSASDIRYNANTSWVDYSTNVIGVFSKASSGGSPSADCVVEVMSE